MGEAQRDGAGGGTGDRGAAIGGGTGSRGAVPSGTAGHGAVPSGTRSVRITAAGHAALRASHHKTLEITTEPAVGPRATCVVGVAARFDPEPLGRLRGEVRLDLQIAGQQVTGTATINPDHLVRDRLVIRRSRHRDPDTLAVDATLTAADLPPSVTAALTDPAATLTLTLTETATPPPLVIVAPADAPAPTGRLGTLWSGALPIDLTRPAIPVSEETTAATVPSLAAALPEPAASWLVAAVRDGARIAVPAGADPTGCTAALLAAGLPPTPVLWLGHHGGDGSRSVAPGRRTTAWLAALLRSATVPAVVAGPAEALARALAPAPATARVAAPATARVAVPDRRLDLGIAMHWCDPVAAAARLADRAGEEVTVVIGPATDPQRLVGVDAAIQALVAGGVTARTLATALRPLGIDRRQIYSLVADRSTDADSHG